MRKATRVILIWYQKLRFFIATLSFLLLAADQPLFHKLPPFFFSGDKRVFEIVKSEE